MKKHLLIVVVFLSFGAVLNNASAQQSANPRQSSAIPRKPTVSNRTVVDVRPQFNAILNRKRDGKFLLYSDKDGTKVFLNVRDGKPLPLQAFDKYSRSFSGVTLRNENEQCYECIWIYTGWIPLYQVCHWHVCGSGAL